MAALLVTALAVGAWVLIALLVVRAAPSRHERITLLVLVLVSSTVGYAILFGLLAGFDGDNDQLPGIILTLLLPGLIGACFAVGTRRAQAAHAFFLALWGAVFVPGAYAVLVVSLFAIGSSCLS